MAVLILILSITVPMLQNYGLKGVSSTKTLNFLAHKPFQTTSWMILSSRI